MLSFFLWYNVLITDAQHEAYLRAKRQFADYKIKRVIKSSPLVCIPVHVMVGRSRYAASRRHRHKLIKYCNLRIYK